MKNILYLLIGMLAFTACSDDSDPVLPQYKASVLADIAQKEYILLPEDKNNDLFTLNWTSTEQEDLLVGPPSYCIQIDTVGGDFKSAITTILAQTPDHTVTLKVKDLNSILTTVMMQKPEVECNLELRIITRFGLGNALIPSTASNVLTLKVTPYDPDLAKLPLYFTGNMLLEVPEWKNDAADIGNGLQVFFADNSNPKSKKYTYTATFNAASGGKFPTVAGVWDPCWGHNGTALVYENGSPNMNGPATAGIYTLNLDLDDKTAEFVPYTAAVKKYLAIGIIGDASPTGWDSDTKLTQVTPHVWVLPSIELKANKEVKFRANSDWADSWGITGDNQELPYSKGSYGGGNIKITKDGNYYVALNDLTGHYIIIERSELPVKPEEKK